jgi:hypothetical protein
MGISTGKDNINMKRSLRIKLVLLLALFVSTIGANLPATARACQGCSWIYDHGKVIGYGCVNQGTVQACQATSQGCTTSGFCF